MTTSSTTLHRAVLSSLCLLVFVSVAVQPVHAQNDWPAWGLSLIHI